MFKKLAVILTVVAVLGLSLTACIPNGFYNPVTNKTIRGSGEVVTESRDVSNFERVDLQGIGNLEIVQGDEESLTITAEDNFMQYITTEVVGDTLEIGMKPNLSLDPSRTIEYKLVLKSVASVALSGFGNINSEGLTSDDLEVKLNGSGDIVLGTLESETLLVRISGFGDFEAETITADKPTLEITGSGDINVDQIDAVSLAVKISGFGDANLSGTTVDQDVMVTGSGDYNADDLESEDATVKITGFGKATLWAKENLVITITGSGDVNYYGAPRITQTMTGFGKVNSLGEHK
jgi:hypothetical protein